jgi:hypothetical protein
MNSKKVLDTPSEHKTEVENEKLIYSKEEVPSFSEQQKEDANDGEVIGRDWGISSNDDG